MKKRFWGISILTVCIAFMMGYLAGHDEGRNTQPDVVYPTTFYATVTDVGTQGLVVEGLEINQINYRGTYGFSIAEETQLVWRGTPVELNEFHPGLTVSVSFTGHILESNPAGITEVCRVEILDDEFRSDQKSEVITAPLGQTAALHAYDQIQTSLGALLPHEPGFPNYPDEFGDAYYEDGFLVVCLTDISDKMQEKYRTMVDTPQILQFKQVTYSYNDLFALQNAIRPTEGIALSSWGIDVKENCVSVGIPDMAAEAATRSTLTEAFSQEVKDRFANYPISFHEEATPSLT